MDLWKIILIIILIIIIIIGITNIYFKTDILYDSILDCNIEYKTINDLKKESSANMSFSMWYFINEFQPNNDFSPLLTYYNNNNDTYDSTKLSDKLTNLFNDNYASTSITKVDTTVTDLKAAAAGGTAAATDVEVAEGNNMHIPTIHIALNNNRNDIHIFVRTSDTAAGDKVISRFVLKNVPLQKWVNLSITIDNNVFDVYLDGKLHNSFILPDALFTQTNNVDNNKLFLNGGGNVNHNTFLTRIRYIDSAITTVEAYDIYKDGISSNHATSLFNKYNLKVSFLEYNQEKSSFII